MKKDYAIRLFGGRAQLAKAVKVHTSQVSRWAEVLPFWVECIVYVQACRRGLMVCIDGKFSRVRTVKETSPHWDVDTPRAVP